MPRLKKNSPGLSSTVFSNSCWSLSRRFKVKIRFFIVFSLSLVAMVILSSLCTEPSSDLIVLMFSQASLSFCSTLSDYIIHFFFHDCQRTIDKVVELTIIMKHLLARIDRMRSEHLTYK